MNESAFGINLSFAVKRWPEPAVWAGFVREELGLSTVQFTFDLLDPMWPESTSRGLADQIREAAATHHIFIHSAFVGLANYTYNGLLHPLPEGRAAALEWWRRAVWLAAELGAGAIGGPLGGLSVTDGNDPLRKQALYDEMTESIGKITTWAKEAGLKELLIEPTPLMREFPHTIEQAKQLVQLLKQNTAIPVRYVIDVGHALYQPLYGPQASLSSWLNALGDYTSLIHLQNTDFQSDSHWGWPHPQGKFNLDEFASVLKTYQLSNLTVILEIFYPFEESDQNVKDNIVSSVKHCKSKLINQR
jgi:sugar phosphate isomerase/epimerase